MRKQWMVGCIAFVLCTLPLSSKDKQAKVLYVDMAIGMRDAFNCGVIVEQYLHGSLKGNPEGYRKEQVKYNCDHVQAVLSSLHDQDNGNGNSGAGDRQAQPTSPNSGSQTSGVNSSDGANAAPAVPPPPQ